MVRWGGLVAVCQPVRSRCGLGQGGAGSVSEKAGDRIDILFLGGEEQLPWIGNCDANSDGTLDIGADPIYILNYLFQGGPAPEPWG
jgi:hypothetical protein